MHHQKESEEDLITSAEKAKRMGAGGERPVSGKTTAKGGPISGGQIEEYEDEEEDYDQHPANESIDNSSQNLNKGELSVVQQKVRPRTAKTKNEEDNVFYRRQIAGGSNPVYTSTHRAD